MLVDSQDMELVKIIIHRPPVRPDSGGEGVEDQESLVMLRELGCDYAQGYHLAGCSPRTSLKPG